MIKKSFIGLAKPRLMYESLESLLPEPQNIAIPEKVTLFLETNPALSSGGQGSIKENDKVKTGQKLTLSEQNPEYVIATVTGTISSITPLPVISANSTRQFRLKPFRMKK